MDFTGPHPISYLCDFTPSFFSRSVKSLSPSYSSEHRVTVYAVHNPQPNRVCHYETLQKRSSNDIMGMAWIGAQGLME